MPMIPKSKPFILTQDVDNFIGTVYRQTLFAEFEHFIYTEDAKGTTLTPDLMAQKFNELFKTYNGAALVTYRGRTILGHKFRISIMTITYTNTRLPRRLRRRWQTISSTKSRVRLNVIRNSCQQVQVIIQWKLLNEQELTLRNMTILTKRLWILGTRLRN